MLLKVWQAQLAPPLRSPLRRLLQTADACQLALNAFYNPLEVAAASIVNAVEIGDSAALAYQCNTIIPPLAAQAAAAERQYCTSSSVDTTAKATINNLLNAIAPYCGGAASDGSSFSFLSLSGSQSVAAWTTLTVLFIVLVSVALAYRLKVAARRAGDDAAASLQGQATAEVGAQVATLRHLGTPTQWAITRCLFPASFQNTGRCLIVTSFADVVLPAVFLCAAAFQPLMLGEFIFILVTLSCVGFMRDTGRSLQLATLLPGAERLMKFAFRTALAACVLAGVLQVYGAFVEAVCSASNLQAGVSDLLDICTGSAGDSVVKAWVAGTWTAQALGFISAALLASATPSVLYLNELALLTKRPGNLPDGVELQGALEQPQAAPAV